MKRRIIENKLLEADFNLLSYFVYESTRPDKLMDLLIYLSKDKTAQKIVKILYGDSKKRNRGVF